MRWTSFMSNLHCYALGIGISQMNALIQASVHFLLLSVQNTLLNRSSAVASTLDAWRTHLDTGAAHAGKQACQEEACVSTQNTNYWGKY